MPSTERSDHSVFIIESEGARDLIDNVSEGEGLQRVLRLSGVKAVFRRAECKSDFVNLIKVFLRTPCRYLHLSCHGNQDGLALTNGEIISWSELFHILEPAVEGCVLHLSSCESSARQKLVDLFATSESQPFIVAGSPDKITWHQAFIAWAMLFNAYCRPTEMQFDAIQNALIAAKLGTGADIDLTFFIEKEVEDDKPYWTMHAKEEYDEFCEKHARRGKDEFAEALRASLAEAKRRTSESVHSLPIPANEADESDDSNECNSIEAEPLPEISIETNPRVETTANARQTP